MRIRKRQVPLPLSSLSPVPLSDLHLHLAPPPVQLRRSSPPLDRPCSAPDFDLELDLEKEDEDEKRSRNEEEEEKEKKSNGSSSPTINPPQSVSSPSNQVERWCDGDKAFPLKKRRGSFERRGSAEASGVVEAKMKTKMNNKCDVDHRHGDDDAVKEEREAVLNNSGKKKRGGRGGAVLMEGSRCSRVNGRGWRCCQQTLVGYSLCEHHLGKGRLRSMASVRSRSLAAAGAGNNAPKKKIKKTSVDLDPVRPSSDHKVVLLEKPIEPVSSCFLLSDEDEDEDEGKDDDLMLTNKKRMRLGMVKARSMSSLLGQSQPINNKNASYAQHHDHDHNHNPMQI